MLLAHCGLRYMVLPPSTAAVGTASVNLIRQRIKRLPMNGCVSIIADLADKICLIRLSINPT
jgi:hypothetical protein